MRFPLVAIPLFAVVYLAACSSPDETVAAPSATASAAAIAKSPARSAAGTGKSSATARSAGAVSAQSDDGVLEFSYKHPAEVGAIPELATLLRAEADKAQAEARKAALDDRDSAKTDGYELHGHSLGIAWEVVTQTPRFLSLSNSFYTFSGGAHGNYGFEGLVWDRREDKRLAAMMTMKDMPFDAKRMIFGGFKTMVEA